MTLLEITEILKGGSGSGDWGHTGRAGRRGGSGGGGGKGRPRKGRRSREALNKEIEANKKKKRASITDTKIAGNLDITEKDVNFDLIKSEFMDKFPAKMTSLASSTPETISKLSGVDEVIVKEYIVGWNSNNTSRRYIVSKSAQDVLGAESSPYEKINKDKWDTAASDFNTPDKIKDYAKITAAIYSETQRQLKEVGIAEITLYRGFLEDDNFPIIKGNTTKWHGNGIDSWTIDGNTARGFSSLARRHASKTGRVLKAIIPANRIFSMPSSGPGTSNEKEITVLGNGSNDEISVVI